MLRSRLAEAELASDWARRRSARLREGLSVLIATAVITACGKGPNVSDPEMDLTLELAFTVHPSATVAGEPFVPAVTVQIQNAAGAPVADAKRDITVALTDAEGATLLGATTVASANGEATFPDLTVDKSGSSFILMATSSGIPSAVSHSFSVDPGPPARLGFSAVPVRPLNGAAFAPPVEVEVQDAFGNATEAGSSIVEVAMGDNPSGGSLFGVLVEQAVDGVAKFPFLAIDGVGGGYTLVASAPGLDPVTSTSIDVEPSMPGAAAPRYLQDALHRYHTAVDVYSDADAAGNHFALRGRLSSPGDESSVPPMSEADACGGDPRSGADCIRSTFRFRADAWGGWYFLNGVLDGGETRPSENWGTVPDAGLDLTGATALTFWARGEQGGEKVKFVALGIGRDEAGQPIEPFPGSSTQVGLGLIQTLTTEWQRFEIDLTGKDLSYVLGGFGWVATAADNPSDITFFLDDIGFDLPRLGEPRFATSYETERSGIDFDVIFRNVAFTYDNAITLLALLAAGETEAAKLIADAFVYAQNNDRFYDDGRLRNAYQGGDLVTFPGWTPNGRSGTVRLPGWSDRTTGQWLEDPFQVGTHTGNMAWVVLALLAYYELSGDGQYLAASETLANWIEDNTRDATGLGGYTLGYSGPEPIQERLTPRSTEHNIDVYAAFRRLFLITGSAVWQQRAEHAKMFVMAMWDPVERKFWTGTEENGGLIFTGVVPLEIQAWAALAFREEGFEYWSALAYAEARHNVSEGFDFNRDRDGIWYEGTAHMALGYYFTGQTGKWNRTVDFLRGAQEPSGGITAANRDELTTGFLLRNDEPLFYYRRAHIAATGWLTLAEAGANPFWLGHTSR